MDLKKFILENKKAIAELAKQNAQHDEKGCPLLTKEEVKEEACWNEVYKDKLETKSCY